MSSKQIIVKYTHNKDVFEILVDSELAYEYISGKRSDPLNVLENDEVWKDSKKGIRQSNERIINAFGTTDIAKVADQMLKKGNVPFTTEHRKRMLEDKKKRIVEEIARNSMDARTNAPVPKVRIENAMREARINIDPFKSVSEQVGEVVDKLRILLPIKFTTLKIQIIIPAEYASKSYGTLKQFTIKSEEWMSNGGLKAIVEIPAGLQNTFYEKMNRMSNGNVQTEIIK